MITTQTTPVFRANELFLQYDYLYDSPADQSLIYSPRDVIVIKEYDSPSQLCLAIVLGAIDNTREDLRTDANGMIGFDEIIRHATLEDFANPAIKQLSRSNRLVEEVSWHCIDISTRHEEGVVYAFDTFFQCDRYRKYRNLHHSPTPISWRPEGEIVDILEYFRVFDKCRVSDLQEKHGFLEAYTDFTCDSAALRC